MTVTGDNVHDSASARGEGTTKSRKSGNKLLRISCWCVALALGAADAWATRFTMYPDGVSYLDVGDAYWRGDWHNAINAYWSPLYPWIVGFFLKVFKPSAYWEYPLVHLVNFLIYVAALACFDWFLNAFITQEKERHRELDGESEVGLPSWAWLVLGYSTFVTSSLLLITISFVSGDMAIAAIVYVAAALILKIRKGHAGWGTFAALGLVLGIGYFTKAVMFLMAVPFLVVAVAAQRALGRSMNPAALSFLIFAATVFPFVLLLSVAKGKPTFGDSGKINYEISLNSVNFFIPRSPAAKYPVRMISDAPAAYEYSYPITGTYPLWYDPSYWHEGIQPQIDVKTQLLTVFASVVKCLWISLSPVMGLNLTTAILFLYLIAPGISGSLANARLNWVLWVPAVSGIALYCLVVIEPRYIAALLCILWIVGLSGARLPIFTTSRRLVAGTMFAVAITTCLAEGWQISRALSGSDYVRRRVATPACWRAAGALEAGGLKPGDKLAVIGDWLVPSEEAAYVARLARTQIIAEARSDEVWPADAPARSRVIAAFGRAGAKAILTYRPTQTEDGWERLGDTGYYLYRLGAVK